MTLNFTQDEMYTMLYITVIHIDILNWIYVEHLKFQIGIHDSLWGQTSN